MFTFVYQPKANRETLREFNARVQEFCSENPVVNIEALHIGDNLMLQGSTADDMDVDNVPTLTAVVRTIDPADSDLEEQLDGLIEQEMAKHNPDAENGDPNLPIKFIVVQTERRSWAVLICVNGVAEDEEDGGGDGGGDGEGEPQPAGPPAAAGFQG
jgi:hypothetical protein